MKGVEDRGRAFQSGSEGAKYRRFGPFGPAYEVLEIRRDTAHVRVVESGEELDYPLAKLRDDPQA